MGHAQTFWQAAQRARSVGGTLRLRSDDLDRGRCRPEFVEAMQEDLRWLGLNWDGPIVCQSARIDRYRATLQRLHAANLIFPCTRSRRDVEEAVGAPHEGEADDEPLYPKEFRPSASTPLPGLHEQAGINWRFRVPDGAEIVFQDARCGEKRAIAGRDFGDFLVWRKDDTPSYQLATVVDDAEMEITEVVRGADLIKSTFRQILLFQALEWPVPKFFHAPLRHDEHGQRLAKRHDALALRTLRAQGVTPEETIESFQTR